MVASSVCGLQSHSVTQAAPVTKDARKTAITVQLEAQPAVQFLTGQNDRSRDISQIYSDPSNPDGYDPLSITVIILRDVRLVAMGNERLLCHRRETGRVM